VSGIIIKRNEKQEFKKAKLMNALNEIDEGNHNF
jgi:hypothetical protein